MAQARARFQFTAICAAAAILTAFGFLAIDECLSLGGLQNHNVNVYLDVWVTSILLVVLGIIMMLMAYLVSSSNTDTAGTGGIFGMVMSVISLLFAINLMSTINSIPSSGYGLTLGFGWAWMVIGYPILTFVGFPLGVIGSLGAIRNSYGAEEPETVTEKAKA